MPKDVIMPALGVAQETGRVLRWLKPEGERVSEGDLLLEIETDKATVELETPASGVLLNVSAGPGDEVPVGTVIAQIWADSEVGRDDEALITEAPENGPSHSGSEARRDADIAPTGETTIGSLLSESFRSRTESGRVPSSPKARRLASERGIDLSRLSGAGHGHAVIASDVLQQGSSEQGDPTALSRVWRVMADRMAEAWRTIPHFYLVREMDAGKLVEWRQALRGQIDQEITFTDLLVKKVATCLRSHPQLNSQWLNGSIVRQPGINIGLAVALDQALIVPVIRDAERLTVPEIAAERSRLVGRAQTGKLRPDDISAGTFTISNLGMYGVDSFQAIVNPPQAAILAVGRIASRLVLVDNEPAVRPMMTLSVSCDHRVVDGARGALFLADLAASVEQASPLEI